MAPTEKKKVSKVKPLDGRQAATTARVVERARSGGASSQSSKHRHRSPPRVVYFSISDEDDEDVAMDLVRHEETHEPTAKDMDGHKLNIQRIHAARLTIEHFAVVFCQPRKDELKIASLLHLLWKLEAQMRHVNSEFLADAQRHNCADCKEQIAILEPIEVMLQKNTLV